LWLFSLIHNYKKRGDNFMGIWSSIKRKLTGGDESYFENLARGELAARVDRGGIASRRALRTESDRESRKEDAAEQQRFAAEQAAVLKVRSVQEMSRQIHELARRDMTILTQERASLDAAFVSLDIVNEVKSSQSFIDRLHQIATFSVKADAEVQVLFAQIMQNSANPGEMTLNKSTWKQMRDDADAIRANLAVWDREFRDATQRAKEWRDLLRVELKKVQQGIGQLDAWLRAYPKFRDLQLEVIAGAIETAKNSRSAAVPGMSKNEAERAVKYTRTKFAQSQDRHRRLQQPPSNFR
jgi:hypothetical protein